MTSRLTYFSILGVDEDVSQDELEARYQELAEHLASSAIPSELHEWASSQAALVDEAYAVLSDPDRRQEALGADDVAPPAAVAPKAPVRDDNVAGEESETDFEEVMDEDVQRPSGPAVRRPRGRAGEETVGAAEVFENLRSQPIFLGAVVGLVVLGALLFVKFGMGGDGGDSSSGDQVSNVAPTAIPLDLDRVEQLMTQLQENPNDVLVLVGLGDVYAISQEWPQALEWYTKATEADEENIDAWIGLGDASSALGGTLEAKEAWLRAVKIDPNNVDVHLALGFMYLSSEPPDLESARREFEVVVELDPDSAQAQAALAHLPDPDEEGAGPSPTPSGDGAE